MEKKNMGKAFIIMSIIGAGLCQHIGNVTNVEKAVWEHEIKQQYKLISKYFNLGDFTYMETLYTDDCILMFPGYPEAKGRIALGLLSEPEWGNGQNKLTLISQEVTTESRGLAVDRGKYVLKREETTLFDVGKFIKIWKRVKGEPKIYIEIWNSNSI